VPTLAIMRRMFPRPNVLLCGLLAAVTPAQAPAAADPKVSLDVLYVGSKDGARTPDFVAFLQQHFRRVNTAVYRDFQATDADPYDVVVLDVEMQPKENSIGIGPQPVLPAGYARATVLVNGPGVIVAEKLGSKIDWW